MSVIKDGVIFDTPTFAMPKSSCLVAIATTALLSTLVSQPAQAKVRVLDFDHDALGNALSGGTQADDQWSDWGLNITGKNYKTDKKNAPLLLYDTDSLGADNDLRTGATWGTVNQGNALIIQEYNYNNDSYNLDTPDDEAGGGHIWFKFDQEVSFQKFSLLDIDDNFGDVSGVQVRVVGKDADDNKVLDINIDDLIRRFAGTYSDSSHSDSQGKSLTHAYQNDLGDDINVTITQMGNKRNNNSLFEFELDETALKKVKFQYNGVSGAISELQWDDLEQSEAPPQLPEPSVGVGLMMLGFVGTRRFLLRRLR